MLIEFLERNREELLARARLRVAERDAPRAQDREIESGLAKFLEQLRVALARAAAHESSDHAELGKTAEDHGFALFERGLTIAQVVHAYGDLCQVITGLAVELKAQIAATEFQTLNLCLDDAIASAVTAYGRQRDRAVTAEGAERLGVLAHELRNLLNSAVISAASMQRGIVGVGGSTAAILNRSLLGMHVLLDRSFAEVRLDSGVGASELFPIAEVINEVEIGAAMFAEKRNLRLLVQPVDPTVMVAGDRQILAAALTNLLQNAFKFTKHGSKVTLTVTSTSSRVLVAVQDECGGLPAGSRESLLRPFVQRARDRTGLGLGLVICVRAMQSMSGELHVEDLPGRGCVFTLDLPRQPPSPKPAHSPV